MYVHSVKVASLYENTMEYMRDPGSLSFAMIAYNNVICIRGYKELSECNLSLSFQNL